MRIRSKPFRTLKTPVGKPDHFTVEQADAAVLAVMAERGETPVLDSVEEPAYLDLRRGRSQSRRKPVEDARR
ncbi:MAG TPA: hypothetical protein VGO40_14090 [Longimicrobium sp.]|nr:hypothetical protein [Longimicrobium sp.]